MHLSLGKLFQHPEARLTTKSTEQFQAIQMFRVFNIVVIGHAHKYKGYKVLYKYVPDNGYS
ncbi:hypothetical protein Mpsy_1886 [Methanolobus psychrophilus R15]|nr:hypothetical protein Mpsy_1886 [Methanolobus psychrophilus R15]